MAEAAGLPFLHVPVTAGHQAEAEARLLELVAEHRADLVVLARYMQVLSDETVPSAARPGDQHPPFVPARASRARSPTTRRSTGG